MNTYIYIYIHFCSESGRETLSIFREKKNEEKTLESRQHMLLQRVL